MTKSILCFLAAMASTLDCFSAALDPKNVSTICNQLLAEGDTSVYQWQVDLPNWAPHEGENYYGVMNPAQVEEHIQSKEVASAHGFDAWINQKDQFDIAAFNSQRFAKNFGNQFFPMDNPVEHPLTNLSEHLGYWFNFQVIETPYKVVNTFNTTAEKPRVKEVLTGRLLAIHKKSIVIETNLGVVKEIIIGDYWSGLKPIPVDILDLLPKSSTPSSAISGYPGRALGPMGAAPKAAATPSVWPTEMYIGQNEQHYVHYAISAIILRPNEYIPGTKSYLGKTVVAALLTVNQFGQRVMSHLIQGEVVAEFKEGIRLKSADSLIDILSTDPLRNFIFINEVE